MLKLNKIYNEDCLQTMSKMPNEFIDLIVTSPPYDGLREYDGYSFLFETIAKELYRVLKVGGILVWVVNDSTIDGSETLTSAKQKIFFHEQCGFNIHDTMIYHKHSPPLTHNRYEQHFEYMFVLSKGKPKTFNPIMEKTNWAGEYSDTRTFRHEGKETGKLHKQAPIAETKIKGNVWHYVTGYNKTTNDDCFDHPAMFPEKLAKEHIYSWSNEGNVVYDPFSGSGTTCKMAHLQKRNWIGSEISKEYCELSEKRLAPYLAQTQLF